MTVESDIVNALAGLVDGRVFPDEAPFGTEAPYVTYHQAGGEPLNFLEGIPDKRNGRFQFVVWATSRPEASRLIRQIEDTLRLDPKLLAHTLGGALGLRQSDLDLFGATQDFSIWFTD
ncbi:DUF3168 domain-containing protein [Cupriavidus basilensis]|uniref:DUF3168 domain-containing protein n=1 Tax=Cupriavidus basilensis TaxID=68895 RepID=A0ABT6AWZ9_9BURK|nr:DUF3168 domain-containing protein [Cupriavidus basilensis]MDF3837151.1 DUF3168 domain-containing protein [Cupriavidus basilensis]